MKYFLFLDDDAFRDDKVRDPEVYYPLIDANNILELMKDYTVVKFTTVEDSIAWIKENGCPNFISFDNDLMVKLEGKDLAKWIIEEDQNNNGFIPDDFQFFVHSQNINAKKYIYSLLNSYLEFREENKKSNKMKI